ncbi:MAG: hypothetical protein BWK76_11265 [Desulfobulbaceae bacterium A2]|nr:MAG: hypothetical protein BWK76_11265 [Desulfobulbaceae bacterium A2]
MSAPGLFSRFRNDADPGLSFQPRRCLRNRFRGSSCELCRRECPAGALTLVPGAVVIDQAKCMGCLACAAVCPAHALELRDQRLADAMSRLLQQPGLVVACCCEKSVRTGEEIILPCLGALSVEHLAAFATLGRGLHLHLEHCHDCRAAAVPEILERRLAELHTRLGPAGEGLAIRLLRRAAPSPCGGTGEDDVSAETASPSAGSRRAFFRAFREVSRHAVQESWSILSEDQAAERSTSREKEAIPRSQVLRQVLDRVGAGQQRALFPLFHNLTVADTCNLCGACAGMCPTGALQVDRQEEGTKTLRFHWAACSGCGLCQEFCRPRSIQLSPGCPVADLAMDTITLVQREPA